MTKTTYLDINVIQNIPPSCVNRDDTGSPKTGFYGGVKRARVSSQSWKMAMRRYFRERFDESDLGIRTTRIVDLVSEKIQTIDESIAPEDAVEKAVKVIEAAGVKIETKKKKNSDENSDDTPQAKALFFMSIKQAENLASLAIDGGYTKKDVQEALNKGFGIDIALFGRMVADDPTLNTDASSQVAHSISTHRVENEYDYYTAVDDMSPEDNAGAGMIGTIEYNSSTLYRYATIAVHDLCKQLGDKEATSRAVGEFVRAFILSMPTGKQNTFANRTVPYSVFIAVRDEQPVNLVGAFESPVPSGRDGGYAAESVRKMVEHEKELCDSFVSEPSKTWQIGQGLDALGPCMSLENAIADIEQFVRDRE